MITMNEERAVARVIEDICDALHGREYEIVVVDSSRDATPEARAVSSTTDGFSLMLLCLDRFELRRLDYREVLGLGNHQS